MAEDGNPVTLGAALEAAGAEDGRAAGTVRDGGVFAVPAGAEGPGPLLPGHAFEFTAPGDHLSFVHHGSVQSNDPVIPANTGPGVVYRARFFGPRVRAGWAEGADPGRCRAAH